MLNIVKTKDRLRYLLFTPPYARNPSVIISLSSTPYENLNQLAGKTVAYPKRFFQGEVLEKSFPRIDRLPVKDVLAGLKAVLFGKASLIFPIRIWIYRPPFTS